MTDSGACKFVLGIELVTNFDGSVTLCQRRYVDDILERFGMEDCKALSSPVDIQSRPGMRTRPTQQYRRAQHPQYCDYGSQYAVPRAFEQVIVG